MPLLGLFLYNCVAAFTAWLVKYFTRKVAFTIAFTTIVTALLTAIYASIRVLVSSALEASASMHPMFAAGVSVVISPTLQQCITAYLATWSLCELYKWKMNLVFLWSRIF